MPSSSAPPPKKKSRKAKKSDAREHQFIDSGEFEFVVSSIEFPYASDEFMLGCIEWKILLSLNDQTDLKRTLNIELIKCKKEQSCKVVVIGNIELQKYNKHNRRIELTKSDRLEEFNCVFKNEQLCHTFKMQQEVPKSKSGIADSLYFNNGRLTLILCMKIGNIRKTHYPHFDFYRKDKDSISDVIINVGERRFYVNKQFMSIYSPFFERLFNTEFLEKGKQEIEIKDAEPQVFHEFLQLIYPTGRRVKLALVEKILAMADRFLCPYVIALCETRLIDKESNTMRLEEKLKLADKHNLMELMGRVMQNLCTFEQLKAVKGLTGLKTETLEMIIRKFQATTPTPPKKGATVGGSSSQQMNKSSKKRKYEAS